MLLGVLCVVYLGCVYGTIVRTSVGELDGSEYLSKTGKHVFTFLGVPYAKPPVGSRRFREPELVDEWKSVRPAKEYGPLCAQDKPLKNLPGKSNLEEDCLYLNVYTPSMSNSSKLPVLVYFHAGAFMFGESEINKPDFLLDAIDIVFVSVNYRLGPFGFLSTEDDVVPGNNGLKDQALSLKWIKSNIEFFGGDSDRVTISGCSAGGASVHYHFLSEMSRGLFHKGISLSGSALVPWALAEEPLQKAKVLAASVGCPTNSTDLLVDCLRKVPTEDILSKVETLFMPWLSNPFSPFGPVVEKSFKNTFLSDHPYYLLKTGKIADVPWLASVTTEEGLYPAASFIDRDQLVLSLNKDWLSIAPHLLDFNFTSPLSDHVDISHKVKQFYFKDKDISLETRDILVEMLGDRMFKAGMAVAAKEQALVTSSPVYFYMFGYRGNVSLSNALSEHKGNYGTSHFDDMYYIFSMPESERLTDSDMEMVKAMTGIWTSFILEGQPSLPGQNKWEPVSSELARKGPLNYLMIRDIQSMEMMTDGDFGNHRFWKSLNLEENVDFTDLLMVEKFLVIK